MNKEEIIAILRIEKNSYNTLRLKTELKRYIKEFKELAKRYSKYSIYLKSDYPVYTGEKKIIAETKNLISLEQ